MSGKSRNAWVEKRGTRYIGRYRDEERKAKSAGTFDTKEQALAAAERRAGLGKVGDYLDMTLEEYLEHWRDSRLGEEKITKDGKIRYHRLLSLFVLPTYGRRMVRDFDNNPWLAHEIVGSVLSHPKARPTSQKRVKDALGSAFRPLVKMRLIRSNPAHGVEYQAHVKRSEPIFTPDEFYRIVDALPHEAQRACMQFMVHSAMRPGEVFALRVSDIRVRPSGTLEIHQKRKVIRSEEPDKPALREVPGSKTGEGHMIRLQSPKQIANLMSHIEREGLSGDDLVFPARLVTPPIPRPREDLSDWVRGGDYGIYENGDRRAKHGTATAYTYGCRCQHCRNEMILVRREQRARAPKKRKVQERPANADDYAWSGDWGPVFHRAVTNANIQWRGKAYTTRAAAATWMFKGGADLVDVQEAMNHRNAATTLIYLRRAKAEEEESPNSALDSVI